MSFLGFGKAVYVVHFKCGDGDKEESFDTYDKALARKADLNRQKIYAYIKKR